MFIFKWKSFIFVYLVRSLVYLTCQKNSKNVIDFEGTLGVAKQLQIVPANAGKCDTFKSKFQTNLIDFIARKKVRFAAAATQAATTEQQPAKMKKFRIYRWVCYISWRLLLI